MMSNMPGLHVVLVSPEIAPNTGNVARTCAAVGAQLHLVRPLGFFLTDRAMRRAGLDYWQHVQVTVHDDWEACKETLTPQVSQWLFFVTAGQRGYADVTYKPGAAIVFGSESKGLPDYIVRDQSPSRLVRIPMRSAIRSLNLANSVAIVAYEARRQQGFPGMS